MYEYGLWSSLREKQWVDKIQQGDQESKKLI